jgi:hypothetical protein
LCRLEHEKACLRSEASEAKCHADRTFAEKVKSEKARKMLDVTVQELRQKLCECEAKVQRRIAGLINQQTNLDRVARRV